MHKNNVIYVSFLRNWVIFSQHLGHSNKKSINQPINQPINQSINQSIDQSINQSINQSIDQSILSYWTSTSNKKTIYLAMWLMSFFKRFNNFFHCNIQPHQSQHHTKQHQEQILNAGRARHLVTAQRYVKHGRKNVRE